MTNKTIERVAKELGKQVEYKKYKYWDYVPHIGETAIVVDVCTQNSGQTILKCEDFSKSITKDYIKSAVEQGAESLGLKNYQNKGFGKIFYRFDEMYPFS